jgi:hypothetical protein
MPPHHVVVEEDLGDVVHRVKLQTHGFSSPGLGNGELPAVEGDALIVLLDRLPATGDRDFSSARMRGEDLLPPPQPLSLPPPFVRGVEDDLPGTVERNDFSRRRRGLSSRCADY